MTFLVKNIEKKSVIWHPNMGKSFLLLYVITNENTLKLKQIDGLLAASKIFPTETRYIYLGTQSLK